MKCIGKPNADGERSLEDRQGDEDPIIADDHPIEDHATCAPFVAPITILRLFSMGEKVTKRQRKKVTQEEKEITQLVHT
eukprot:12905788-Prorocentrum_lima.AAC.1